MAQPGSFEYRFGPFTLDVARETLLKGTRRVTAEARPIRLLVILVERQGQNVSKKNFFRSSCGLATPALVMAICTC